MTKEQLEELVNDTVNRFNKIDEEIKSRQNVINEKQKEISELIDEQKRLQGEYRILIKIINSFNKTEDTNDSSQEVGVYRSHPLL